MNKILISTLIAVPALFSIAYAATHDFKPDTVFKGSSIAGMKTVGAADWSAANGEITGKPKSAEGGWLVLDKGYQDIEFYTEFKCTGACNAGLLFRTTKTADGGLKGIYISLNDADVDSYDMVLSADGKEVSKTKLPRSNAQFTRIAVGPAMSNSVRAPGFAAPPQTLAEQMAEAAKPATAPAPAGAGAGRGAPPKPTLTKDDWNSVQAIVDADIVWLTVNNRRTLNNAATNDRAMGFGPVALHVAGTGPVQFREISILDLNRKSEPAEKVSSKFRMQQLEDFFYSWGATTGDLNHDGIQDVIAGPFYYLGPDYTEKREYTAARSYSPTSNFPEGHVYYAHDYTGDGWEDIVVVNSRPIYLFVNPKGEPRRWDRYNIIPGATSEVEVFGDIDGDKKPEILFAGPGQTMAYAKPDPANPTAAWKMHVISEPGLGGAHGMGMGDVNGDGRVDVVNSRGWWEQPAGGAMEGPWKFHPEQFGTGGGEMGIYDVNGDGKLDVVTSLAAHTYGLAWFEQKRDAQGAISFTRHDIMGDFGSKSAGGVVFTEPHAAAFADLDGDGVPDLITGKRLFSHLDSHLDPDPMGPAVLYWYRTVRNPKVEGGAEFVPELVHNRSGVGSAFVAKDLNGDGAPEIVTAGPKGAFIFWNQMKGSAKAKK